VSFWHGRTARTAAASGALLGAGLVTSAAGAHSLSVGLEVAALGVGGWTFVPQSAVDLVRGRLGVGTLMTIAAIGAVMLGEITEAASLAFLFSIAESLEHFAVVRTRRGLRGLLDLVPERALVRRGGVETEVDPGTLRPGDVLVVRPGERLVTDGVVRAGRSTLDQSALTGESVPVECGPGQTVLAASINGSGVLDVEVTAATADSSVARVVHIVEEAQERKGSGQRLAERIARPLVPAIMVIAALVAVVGTVVGDPAVWVARALVVLVAAAPCAFALSVPVTVVAAVGAATRSGVLIKGGAALEALAGVRVVALDKTGTLTRNLPAVVKVLTAGAATRNQVLGVAAALEAHSEHPLAGSILAAAPVAVPVAQDVEAVIGHGLVGTIDGVAARLGKPGFVDAGALTAEVSMLQEAGATVVLVASGGRTLGAIAVRDELRPEAAAVVGALRQLGVARVAMLTGDNRRTAEALGAACGVDEVRSELLPEDKARIITDLRVYGPVAMVGDGINDAPALATADVGVAMAAVGADVAIEAADVAIMGQDLAHLPAVLAHARRAGRIMRQNLALSAAILVVLVPLAATGVLGLATVVAAHELAEVVVIANGVRAGRHRGVATVGPGPVSGTPATGTALPATICEDDCCRDAEARMTRTMAGDVSSEGHTPGHGERSGVVGPG
jgi:cation-transporting ATPase G